MLKTWWFEGAAPGFRLPAARSARGPTVHYNRAMITPTLLRRFSVPPQLSALRLQPSRHVIVPAQLALSLSASHNLCPSITASHMWHLVTLPRHYSDLCEGMYFKWGESAGQTDVPLQKRVNDLTKKTWLWFLISWFLLVWQLNGLKHIFKN